MTKTEWLYGVKAKWFEGMEFFEALEERARLARIELFKEVREGQNRQDRVRDINDAIEWCQNLLSERDI